MAPKRPDPKRFHLERTARGLAALEGGRVAVGPGGRVNVVRKDGTRVHFDESTARRIPATKAELKGRIARLRKKEAEARELRYVQSLLPKALDFYQTAGGIKNMRGLNRFTPKWDKYKKRVYKELKRAKPESQEGRALLAALERSLEPSTTSSMEKSTKGLSRQQSRHAANAYFRTFRKRAAEVGAEVQGIEESVNRRLSEMDRIGGERNALRQFLSEARDSPAKNLPPRLLGDLYHYYRGRG